MSEWDAHVYCTCFRDGLTIEAPYPRSELTVNRYGVVTLVGSTDHADDPEDLWLWRYRFQDDGMIVPGPPPPCAHELMMLVDEIFYWPGSNSHSMRYPIVEELVSTPDFPLLQELIYRPETRDYPSGGIWVQANEAPALLEELHRLGPLVPDRYPQADDYFLRTLAKLLEASILTGNPIITHYNGLVDGAW